MFDELAAIAMIVVVLYFLFMMYRDTNHQSDAIDAAFEKARKEEEICKLATTNYRKYMLEKHPDMAELIDSIPNLTVPKNFYEDARTHLGY